MRYLKQVSLVLGLLLLVGCAKNLSGDTYSRAEARKVQTVKYGTIESVRKVVIEGRKDGAGAIAGAIIGGIAGSAVGNGKGSQIASSVGVVAGSLAGSKLEENATQAQGQEIVIQLDSGRIISVVQEVTDNKFFKAGQRARVFNSQGTIRVAPI